MSEITLGRTGTTASTNRAVNLSRTRFEYDGRLGQLYWIFIKNILLMMVTFSIWRFWGKTRIRRYLWSHTSLAGDRFEYTGTGGELFIGFLIVMIAYVIGSIGIQILGIFLDPQSPALVVLQACLAFVLLYLTFVAQYAAQRYRLTRTLWRGISGGMTGSAWKWGFKGMWFSLLSLFSLTLAWPWAQMRLIDDRLNNSYFGDAKASIQTSSKSLYFPYLAGFAGSIVMIAVIGLGIYFATKSDLGSFLDGSLGSADKSEQERVVTIVVISFFSFYLSLALVSIIAFAAYGVAIAREIANKLELGGLRFATPLTIGGLISRYLLNMLIIIFTFGLGLPIAIHRTMLFLSRNIEVIGEIEGSAITRAELPRPKFGEGLMEAFDPGIV